MMNKKILIIIKSHDTDIVDYHGDTYRKIEEITRQYLSNVSEVDFVFVKANPSLKEERYHDSSKNIFWCKTEENYWEALKIKVLEAIEYFFYIEDKKYKHVFITNLSTFINAPALITEADNLNDMECATVVGKYSFGGVNYSFPSGAGVLYSEKLIRRLYEYQAEVDHSKYPDTDDVFFGKIIHELNVRMKKIDRVDILQPIALDKVDKERLKNCSHIRIKVLQNREMDINYHQSLSEFFYG